MNGLTKAETQLTADDAAVYKAEVEALRKKLASVQSDYFRLSEILKKRARRMESVPLSLPPGDCF